MGPFDFSLRTRVVFGDGAFARLGELARELSFTRALLVADRGIVATGQVERAAALLDAEGVRPFTFHDFDANPDSRMVDAGRAVAASCVLDSIVAVGGGSSLDCAKGINFVLTNGGTMRDYRGFGKATRPMLPSIGVPTTAGTGSEAQSYALISDSETHAKMACGDPKAAFRVAILDPALTVTQPREVTAMAGYDAISHAVESYVTTRRSDASDLFARDAWRLLEWELRARARGAGRSARAGRDAVGRSRGRHRHRAVDARRDPRVREPADGALRHDARHRDCRDAAARGSLERGTRRRSLRGTARNAALQRHDRGAERLDAGAAGEQLASRLEELRHDGRLPASLRDIGVARDDFAALAADAATQWTGTCNPRPFDAASALELLRTRLLAAVAIVRRVRL